ncbi:bacillithiol biosynthesis BshC [Mangrovibacillus cuniculi]|uniref:Bacillithiol biosynthesis BshC n=1 Tax=Mangrovibacillus cuniculi TaxID=2593652 RepID=A0A7S8CA97_9BACI|nr:bacillithiol biosynthesis BshC [Mangrovibacillus cuniculi]
MQLDKIRVEEKNLFYQTYVNTPSKLASFFDYGVTDEELKRRAGDLKNREYNREDLADHIKSFMGKYHLTQMFNSLWKN